MISLTNIDTIDTDASNREAMAQAGITQASVSASVAASRAAGAAAIEVSLAGTPLGGKSAGAHLNPLHIDGNAKANYQQPDSSNPTPNAATVQVENNHNPLKIVAPLPAYSQPGTGAPAPPLVGQLSTLSYGSIGTSKITLADGSTRST